jgi:hypothetical protein
MKCKHYQVHKLEDAKPTYFPKVTPTCTSFAFQITLYSYENMTVVVTSPSLGCNALHMESQFQLQ